MKLRFGYTNTGMMKSTVERMTYVSTWRGGLKVGEESQNQNSWIYFFTP